MKIRLTAAALCLLALPVLAQDKPKEPAAPAMDHAAEEAMMKAMMPGEQHKRLARMAGDWTFTNKMWMAPGQPPMDSTGTMHAETVLGGRYVQTTWTGNMMGMPFEGHGTEGYDNLAKKYVSTWVDNMGTGIMMAEGACEEGGKKCTTTGTSSDPSTGGTMTMKSVLSWVDDNNFKNEMYAPGPDGKEAKMMAIAYTRRK